MQQTWLRINSRDGTPGHRCLTNSLAMTLRGLRGSALDAAIQGWAERHLHLRFQTIDLIPFDSRTRLGQMELGVCLGKLGSIDAARVPDAHF